MYRVGNVLVRAAIGRTNAHSSLQHNTNAGSGCGGCEVPQVRLETFVDLTVKYRVRQGDMVGIQMEKGCVARWLGSTKGWERTR